MTNAKTRAPFPWFGGKSLAAPAVWDALGDVTHYVEPFAGSLAALLARPDTHRRRVETVNDLDGFVTNAWRALAAAPDEVAAWADWPVSELDLTARHLWLVERRAGLTERLMVDPAYFDAQVAGWWIWGACCWIGSGWCSGDGPWCIADGRVVNGTSGQGVHRQLPHLGDSGRGVHRQLPHLGDSGRGVHRKLPHLGNSGRGVHRQLPHLGDSGRGDGLRVWFGDLAARLERVRICCGPWERVLSDAAIDPLRDGSVGVFLDPPYREGDIGYAEAGADEGAAVWDAAAAWAVEHGDRLRIVLAGYDGHWAPPDGWSVAGVRSRGGLQAGKRQGTERLWLSPACGSSAPQAALFGVAR